MDYGYRSTIDKSKYVYFGFSADEEDKDHLWKANPVVSVSNDAINWQVVRFLPELGNLRDGSITLIDGTYYLIGTLAMYKTDDFVNFTQIDLPLQKSGYTNVWAPELFKDKDGEYHIIYCANNGKKGIYMADFDPNTDTVNNTYQVVNVDCGNSIDPSITILNGKYLLVLSSARFFTSDNLLGPYSPLPTDIIEDKNAKWYEAPEILVAGDYCFLYQDKIDSHVDGVADSGYMVVSTARKNNLSHWSEERLVNSSINMRHGNFLYNDLIYIQYPDDKQVKDVDVSKKVLTVQAINRKEIEPISCILNNTFQVQWQVNNTYQLQFTAFDDGSLAYELLANESTINFNGQQWIIKTCEPDYNIGATTKQITATHIYNEISRVRQYNTKAGTLTYSVRDVLSFYLDNNTNNQGFTYSVYGDFPKQQIADLGSSSGKDMLSKIISTWSDSGVIIFPNNKDIGVYTPQAFYKNLGNRIDYLHDTQEVKMTIDSTSIVNSVKCYGKQLENSSDNSVTQYYFPPFVAVDYESIGNWGLHIGDDISDDRFTDAKKMKAYALSQMTTDPILSIEVTYDGNEQPMPGETRRLEIKQKSFVSTVNVVGYTWYPLSPSNNTVLEFDNLPMSILNSNASINTRIRRVQQMVQQAMNKAMTSTTNYVSYTDPAKQESNTVRTGDLWTRPLVTGGDNE